MRTFNNIKSIGIALSLVALSSVSDQIASAQHLDIGDHLLDGNLGCTSPGQSRDNVSKKPSGVSFDNMAMEALSFIDVVEGASIFKHVEREGDFWVYVPSRDVWQHCEYKLHSTNKVVCADNSHCVLESSDRGKWERTLQNAVQ